MERSRGKGAFTLGAAAHELDAVLGKLGGSLEELLDLVGHCDVLWRDGLVGELFGGIFRDGRRLGSSGTSTETCSQDWPRRLSGLVRVARGMWHREMWLDELTD